MGIPNKLININAYINGRGHLGEVMSFTPPKLVAKMEEHRAGGMPGPIDIDLGLEKLTAEITMASHTARNIRRFGSTDVTSERVRLVEAFRRQDGGIPEAVEHYIGGRFNEIDFGTSKPGDDTEHKYMLTLTQYSRVVNNIAEVQIDMVNGIYIVDGVDRYGEIMAILTS